MSPQPPSRAGFVLQYAGVTGPDPAALGVWRAATPSVTTFEVSPGAPIESHSEPVPEWHAYLPPDALEAERTFAVAEGALLSARLALPEALRRLQVSSHASAEVTSYAIGLFDGAPAAAPGWEQLVERFQAFLDRVKLAIAPRATVRTRLGDSLVGWTVMRWPSGLATVQHDQISIEERRLHQRAVRLALDTRAMVLRTLVFVVRGAAVLATSVSSPVGPILALPAAWHLINDVQATFGAATDRT